MTATSSKQLQHIEEDVAKGLHTLQQLTSHTSVSSQGADPPESSRSGMPLNEVHFCQGIAFLFSKKVGLGISVERGSGFVIAKLPRVEHRMVGERVTWSAPLFFHATGADLGATIGFHEVDSCIMLDSQRSVEAMTRVSFTMDANVGASAGRNASASLEATTASLTAPRSSYDTFSYTVSKGVMLDISWKGVTVNADNNVNHGLYGAEATGASILNGGHTPPQSQALKQLYAYLDQIMASAPDALLMFGSGAPGRAEQVHEMDGTPSQQRSHVQQPGAAQTSPAAHTTPH